MRVLSFLLLISLTLNSYSQEKITDSINTNWEKSGKFTFLGNQSSYSYWTAGGQTSVSGTIKINYDLNYENNGWNWDTKIITAYGLNSNGGSKFLKKTDDKLEINSLVGKKFSSSNIGDLSYSRFELGSSIRSYYKFEFLENVFVTNRISQYSDYLENPENIDLDYTINTSLKVNKYLTTDLILQFIYDNNAVKRLQVRQVMGIGLSLNF